LTRYVPKRGKTGEIKRFTISPKSFIMDNLRRDMPLMKAGAKEYGNVSKISAKKLCGFYNKERNYGGFSEETNSD
jgi:hypothetical protein